MHRVFVAIPVPPDIKNEITEVRDKLGLHLKFIPPENFHVTVLFMGNVSGSDLQNISSSLEKMVEEIPPFTMVPDVIDRKSSKHNQMLWVKFEQCEKFEELSVKIAEGLKYPLERKPFPHINLIRSKHKIAGSFPLALSHIKLEVSKIEIWESLLKPTGATYSTLNSFTLKGRAYGQEEG